MKLLMRVQYMKTESSIFGIIILSYFALGIFTIIYNTLVTSTFNELCTISIAEFIFSL